MLLVSSHEKVSAIATSLRTSQELTIIYTKVLMKLIRNQSHVMKVQFLAL